MDTPQLTTNERPLRLLITGVRADGKAFPEARTLAFPAGTKRLEVDFDVLTFVQPDSLRGLASGSTNKQLAEELGISIHTVIKHVLTVRAKLGAKNRAEAVRLAIQRGLL